MLQYSTIGDTVNVASRLEQRNKEFSTDILFSHEIYTSLTKDLYDQAKYQGEISLKGRVLKQRFIVYEKFFYLAHVYFSFFNAKKIRICPLTFTKVVI